MTAVSARSLLSAFQISASAFFAPGWAGLLELVADAARAGGWSTRQAAATLGLDHVRVLRRQVRAVLGRLDDARPGPEIALHALLPWEREAIVKIAGERLEIDRSHRELAHRGSRLDAFYASERAVRELMSLRRLSWVVQASGQARPITGVAE